MNFQEAYCAIKEFVQGLPNVFANVTIDFAFGCDRPAIGDWSNPDNIGLLLNGDGIGSKSGVYFFASPDGEIVYIGKATKDNLHHRVWDHLKTPEILPDGTRVFQKHGFSGYMDASNQIDDIRNGKSRLGVITVSAPEVVSLIEVYLHTLHVKNHGGLPVLNKQIG